MSTTTSLRIGVIGIGRIGLSHAATVLAQPGVSQVLLADADQSRARRAAAELGATASTVTEILAGVDGVVIATPTPTHPELLVAAARARIPTFCEKPIALDVATTRRVIADVEATGTPVQVGFQRRFDPGYRAARRALRAGELGDLRRIHVVTLDPVPPSAEFVPTSGGLFKDVAIHDVDVLRWMSGHEVTEVFAWGVARGAEYFAASGDVSEAVALLTLDDGTLATMQLSRYNGFGQDVRVEVHGTKKSVVGGLNDHTPLRSTDPGVEFPAGEPYLTFYPRLQAAFSAELAAFVQVVRGEFAPPAGLNDALEGLYICEALTRSRTEGRPVRVDEIRTGA